jgi:hypothetical protein
MDIRLNEWSKLKFVDPAKALPKLREIQELIATSNLNEKVKNLRTQKFKHHREGWEATLFCYGMSQLLKTTVFVAPYELSDYDAVSKYIQDDVQHFTPIQIKEVVPERLNPNTSINQEIAKLNRYPASKDTVIVMHVNRPGRLDLSDIQTPKLNISELWLLGASSQDQRRWFIAGDLLNRPNIFEFDYPV